VDTVLGICYTLYMMSSVYDVHGVYSTRCMLYSVCAVLSVSTHDHGMERQRVMA